jgi:rhodanese-related sulfurtransferase
LPDIPSVNPAEVPDLIQKGALLIDVREEVEWDEARIGGAVHRPMTDFATWWAEVPDDRTVVVYCRTGSRSGRVVEALTKQAGMDNLVNLEGGIVAWAEQGFEVAEG